jgi:hypothetical protein
MRLPMPCREAPQVGPSGPQALRLGDPARWLRPSRSRATGATTPSKITRGDLRPPANRTSPRGWARRPPVVRCGCGGPGIGAGDTAGAPAHDDRTLTVKGVQREALEIESTIGSPRIAGVVQESLTRLRDGPRGRRWLR